MKRRVISLTMLPSIMFLSVLALSACEWEQRKASRYQMVTAAKGEVYRLDNETGKVHHISPKGMFQLHDETPVLKVGTYYEMGDVTDKGEEKFLKYLGNGQFEKSIWAVLKGNEENDPLGIR